MPGYIQLTVNVKHQSIVRSIRKEEFVLSRVRLGHTRVAYSCLLLGEEKPQFVGCDAQFTLRVRHFLLVCGDFSQVRNKCSMLIHCNMKHLFQDIHINSIMTF